MNIVDIMAGKKILEKRRSKFNGELLVVKDLAFGTYVQAAGLTQSGGIAEAIWRKPLNKLSKDELGVECALILGLGGGSIAKIVRELWPASRITGVEIDKHMIELGQKYMDLDRYKVDIRNEDATDFLRKNKTKFDLACVDMYTGDKVPRQFTTDEFILSIKALLPDSGVAVFNRLYYADKRKLAHQFGDKLEKRFSKVEVLYPEANVMFLCS